VDGLLIIRTKLKFEMVDLRSSTANMA